MTKHPDINFIDLWARPDYITAQAAKWSFWQIGAMKCLLGKRKNAKDLLMHPMIAFYIANIPDSNFLSVKHRSHIFTLWRICKVKKRGVFRFIFSLKTMSKESCYDSSEQTFLYVTKSHTRYSEKIPIHSVSPVLVKYSFMVISSSVDVQNIFRFKLLHNVSLRTTRLLGECIWNMLAEYGWDSSAAKTESG